MWLLLLFLSIFFYPLMDFSKALFPADSLYFFPPWSELKPAEWQYPKNPLIGRDQSLQILPYRKAVEQALSNGELPLWNSRTLFGAPLLGSGTAAVFYPLTFLSLVFPLWLALNLQAIIKLFVAGYFVYRWMKLFSREEGPAVFAATGAMFCSFNIVWLNHPQSNVSVLLPAAYYFAEKLARQPRWSNVLGLLFTVFLQLLGGHMKAAFLCAVGTGLYFLVRLFLLHRRDANASLTLYLLRFGWAYVLGTLLAAVQVLPFLEFIRQSYTLPHLSSISPGTLPPYYLLNLLNPNLLGYPAAGINWGSINYNEGAIYTGLSTIFILLLILPAQRHSVQKTKATPARSLALALCAINGFLLLVIFGPLAELANHLPLFRLTDFSRLVMVFQLNTILAAGLSFILLLEQEKTEANPKMVIWVSIIIALSSAGIFYSPIRWKENPDYLIFHLVHFAGFLAITALLFFTFLQGKLGKQIFSWSLCLALFADLFLAYGDYNPVVDKKWISPPLPPALQTIRDTPFRVTGLDMQLPPNTSMLAGLSDISGFGNPIDQRTDRFLRTMFAGVYTEKGMRNIISLPDVREIELLKWLNVKYILSSRELPGLKKKYASEDVMVYENPGVFPRARVVPKYEKLRAEQILSEIYAAPENLKGKVFLEKDLPEAQRLTLATNNGQPESSVRILDYGENRVLLEAITAAAGMLVLTDLNFPGWQALVDGQPRPIYQADYLFRAVYLEKGKHTIEFRYRPDSVSWGIFISLLILAKIGIITLWRKTHEGQ